MFGSNALIEASAIGSMTRRPEERQTDSQAWHHTIPDKVFY